MGLIVPRPFLVLTGESDARSHLSGIRVLNNKLQSAYKLYRKEQNFKSIVYENTGHVYTDEMKIEMLNGFKTHLSGQQKFFPGDKAPEFKAVADDGSTWDVSKFLGNKYIVVYFYPAAMTGGCTKQACAYRDHL